MVTIARRAGVAVTIAVGALLLAAAHASAHPHVVDANHDAYPKQRWPTAKTTRLS